MVTQRKPKASKYLTTPTRPVQVDRDRSVAGLLEKMEGTGFGGRQLAEAHRIWLDMLGDNTTIMVAASGALIPAGMRRLLAYVIKNRFVDVLVLSGSLLFHDLHDVKQVLELHKLTAGEPYYIAFMLVGAYQEVMGNNHNLFGAPNEAHVHIDDNGYLIKKVIRGSTVGEAAGRARYDRSLLHDGFRRQVAQRVKAGEMTESEATRLNEFYESSYDAYTYLAVNGKQ